MNGGDGEEGDRQGGVPRRVDAAIDVGCGGLRTFLGIHRVVVLVRVLAPRVQARLRITQHPVEVADRLLELVLHARQGKGLDQAGVVLEHLLEVRHAPVLRRGVAEEAALDVVVGAAAGHLLERVHRSQPQAVVRAQNGLLEQEKDRVGLRKLRRVAEAAIFGVVGRRDGLDHLVDQPDLELSGAARHA